MKKNVTIFLGGRKSAAEIKLEIFIPEKVNKPLPAFIVPGWVNNRKLVIKREKILLYNNI